MPLLAVLLAALAHAGDSTNVVYHGRRGAVAVDIPRREAAVVVDGALDEPAWRDAALLTGFSSYSPVDGRPADDSTDVLVWYSPTAIHFGVRAYEPHGAVHATLADRDRIDSDDFVQILLDPFADRRRAYVFAVNPLGVQTDGIRSEGSFGPVARNQSFGANPGVNIDLSPDFLYESKGRVTASGYEVEVRIPFKSLRYQGARVQRWGIQLIRQVQHSGYQQTWTPAKRASASFLAQSGELRGMSDLHRGLVLELNPEMTTRIDGERALDGDWRYRTEPELGGNVRWGVLPNVTVNGTVRPDFSQVEADATQLAGDVRFALFYPEKRPFFVDGIEQFETPNTLVYTRNIAQPDAAAKVTGKVGAVNLALLSAVDARAASLTGGDHPVFNILRLRRDIGPQSTAGLTYTDRVEGGRFNRLASADARIVFRRLYFAQFQGAASATRAAGGAATATAPLWEAVVDRTGRSFGFHYAIIGIDPEFVAAAGFVPRTGYVRPSINNRVTVFAPKGGLLETWVMRLGIDGTWLYDDFFAGRSVLEQKNQFEHTFTLRGGWTVGVTPVYETYAFDPARYAGYAVERAGAAGAADTVPFAVSPRTHTFYVLGRVQTPQYPRFSARLNTQVGRDVDFFETAPAHRVDVTATVDARPTSRLRLSGSYARSAFRRRRDGSTLSTATIPRLRAEYQLSRAVFFRFVGQYDARRRDALRDPRTDLPIVVPGNPGFARAAALNDFRVDGLFSYRPNPGTVFFAGYGSSLTEADAFAFRDLRRSGDGLFVKLSYLFRL